jgi:hypothetical protein
MANADLPELCYASLSTYSSTISSIDNFSSEKKRSKKRNNANNKNIETDDNNNLSFVEELAQRKILFLEEETERKATEIFRRERTAVAREQGLLVRDRGLLFAE